MEQCQNTFNRPGMVYEVGGDDSSRIERHLIPAEWKTDLQLLRDELEVE